MNTNRPACCADCLHYRGDPSYDCAIANRCMLNPEATRPVWCPLPDAVPEEDRTTSWTPSYGGHGYPSDDYYYIADSGHILCATFHNDNDDKIRVALGNCYRTRAEADAKAREILGRAP